MSQIQLSYFDFPSSRGEECRLALVLAGVDFLDDRISYADWPKRKPEMPYGAVPVLTVDGRGMLAHSNSILNYIAATHGLRSTDSFEAARQDGVMEAVEELRTKTWSVLNQGTSDDEKKAIRKAYAAGPLLDAAASVESQIRGPYVGGEDIRVADLKLWSFYQWFKSGAIDHVPADTLAPFEKWAAVHGLVEQHPKIAVFRAKHAKR